MKSVYWSS